MVDTIRSGLARMIARAALALAPTGSEVERALGPIWRPGSK
jgi:hypothetical protein